MHLQLVNRRQAEGLRKLGFNWKVRDIFIRLSPRRYMEEVMDTEENWNQFEDTLSRPSIPLALQWFREKYNCKCEIYLKDWTQEIYTGIFLFDDMREPDITRSFNDRNWAARDLLTHLLQYKLGIIS